MEDVLELGESRRAGGARMGRRSRAPQETQQDDGENSRSSSNREGPPKPLRQGGWADDSSGTSKLGKRGAEDMEDSRLRQQSLDESDEGGDIPVIPDLEEVQEEDLALQCPSKPSDDLQRPGPRPDETRGLPDPGRDIDLKLLTKVLSPEGDVREGRCALGFGIYFTLKFAPSS